MTDPAWFASIEALHAEASGVLTLGIFYPEDTAMGDELAAGLLAALLESRRRVRDAPRDKPDYVADVRGQFGRFLQKLSSGSSFRQLRGRPRQSASSSVPDALQTAKGCWRKLKTACGNFGLS